MQLTSFTFSKGRSGAIKVPFLERIATFDLEKIYTPAVRFFCHLSMWIVFTSLLQLNLFFDSGLPYNQAVALATKTLLCNILVFYFFFYMALPKTLLKNNILPAIVSFAGSYVLWIILSHYFLIFIATHFDFQSPFYKRAMDLNRNQTFWYVISPENLMVMFISFLTTVSPFFFTKIIFSVIRFYSISYKSERKTVKLEQEKLNLERDFLKAQLNPHFLFNTLNNLYGLSLRKDTQTPEVITQLSEMMRYTLYESNGDKVPLKKELHYLQNYVQLEKMRYRKDAQIICEIDDSNVTDQQIAPLLTFTFVENAFKYGLKKKNEGFIKLYISIKDDIFYFSIQNDKKEKQKVSPVGGIGLENAKKRLELLYPGKHNLAIEDNGKIFFVELTINLNGLKGD
ncbi:MAG: sensor histidine kinase [Ginsengibacter sp.]